MDGLISFMRQRQVQNRSFRQVPKHSQRSQPPRRSYVKATSPESRRRAKASPYQVRLASSIGVYLTSQRREVTAARRSLVGKTASGSAIARASTSLQHRRSIYHESDLSTWSEAATRVDEELRQVLHRKGRPMWTVYRKSPACLFPA